MMPHFPKPFFRAARGLWYVQIDGKQVNLGDNPNAAFAQYHRLMATPHRLPPKPVSGELVVGIIDDFLDWCEKHKARDTYRWYLKRTQSFVRSIPAALTIADFRPFHVTRWIDSHSTWNDGLPSPAQRDPLPALQWEQSGTTADVSHLPSCVLDVPAVETPHSILQPQPAPGLEVVEALCGTPPAELETDWRGVVSAPALWTVESVRETEVVPGFFSPSAFPGGTNLLNPPASDFTAKPLATPPRPADPADCFTA